MNPADRPLYEEYTPWPAWTFVIIWTSGLISAFMVLAAMGGSPVARGAAATGVVVTTGLVHWLLGGTRVRIFRDHLRVALGKAGVFGTRITWTDVETVSAVRYSPLRDFGGWGYRIRPNKRAWTARGDEAVVLRMRDGREVYIGSERADRLRERITTLGGVDA